MYNSKLYEIIKAIEACQRNCNIYEKKPLILRSQSRQRDYIIRVCTGCKDTLSQHDSQKGHAFCLSCREALFPESIKPRKSFAKRFRYFPSRGHFR
jgi:hypothetical protein